MQETPKEGLLWYAEFLYNVFSDVLWSDPIDDDKGECDPPFKPNAVRTCSYFYGYLSSCFNFILIFFL